jgi:hypothetical protein
MTDQRHAPAQADLFDLFDLVPVGGTTGDRPAPEVRRGPVRPAVHDAAHGAQEVLFAAPADPEPAALPYLHADPGPVAAALAGDGYRWLAAILPAPEPVRCDAHHVPMRLDTAVRLLWVCPRCDAETTGTAVPDGSRPEESRRDAA